MAVYLSLYLLPHLSLLYNYRHLSFSSAIFSLPPFFPYISPLPCTPLTLSFSLPPFPSPLPFTCHFLPVPDKLMTLTISISPSFSRLSHSCQSLFISSYFSPCISISLISFFTLVYLSYFPLVCLYLSLYSSYFPFYLFSLYSFSYCIASSRLVTCAPLPALPNSQHF